MAEPTLKIRIAGDLSAIKDTLAGLLDPKPLPYRDQDPDTTDFATYRPSA